MKTYPETRYWGKRKPLSGFPSVYKQILPDGEPTKLPLEPSLKIRDHSVVFEWGYLGSGPAQLALALLLDALSDPETAKKYYYDFKFNVVSRFKKDEWEITGEEIREWLERTKARELQHKVDLEPNKN